MSNITEEMMRASFNRTPSGFLDEDKKLVLWIKDDGGQQTFTYRLEGDGKSANRTGRFDTAAALWEYIGNHNEIKYKAHIIRAKFLNERLLRLLERVNQTSEELNKMLEITDD